MVIPNPQTKKLLIWFCDITLPKQVEISKTQDVFKLHNVISYVQV